MEQFDHNKKIENDLVSSKEKEYDPMKLQRLTLHYAELIDEQGKLWIVQFDHNTWTDEIGEERGNEIDVPSEKIEFINKEQAFLYLKSIAFRKEMEENIAISKQHQLDTTVYERVIELIDQAEKESDENKKKQLILDAFTLSDEES